MGNKVKNVIARLSVMALLSAGLVACNESKPDTYLPPDTSTPTPPPSSPTGTSFTVTGVSQKGLFLNSYVHIFRVGETTPVQETPIRSNSTTGLYNFTVEPELNFTEPFFKVTSQGGQGSTMICDAAQGCGNGVTFGQAFSVDETVSVSAIDTTPSEGEETTVHVTALTDLGARLFESEDNPDETRLLQVYSQVANLFGLSDGNLTKLQPVNLADPNATGNPDNWRAALILSGIMSAIQETGQDFGTALNNLGTSFVTNGGQLIGNEGTDNPTLISLEDILEGAENAAGQVTSTDPNFAQAVSAIQNDLVTVKAQTPDQLTNAKPSPNVGLSDLAQAKAFIADFQLIKAAADADSTLADYNTFANRVYDTTTTLVSGKNSSVNVLFEATRAMFDAHDESITNTSLTSFTARNGIEVAISIANDVTTLTIADETYNGADINLVGKFKFDTSQQAWDPTAGYFYNTMGDLQTGDGELDITGSIEAQDSDLTLNGFELDVTDYESMIGDQGGDGLYEEVTNVSVADLKMIFDFDLEASEANTYTFAGLIILDTSGLDMSLVEGYFSSISAFDANFVNFDTVRGDFIEGTGTLTDLDLKLSGQFTLGDESSNVSVTVNANGNQLDYADGLDRLDIGTISTANGVTTIEHPLRTVSFTFMTYAAATAEVSQLSFVDQNGVGVAVSGDTTTYNAMTVTNERVLKVTYTNSDDTVQTYYVQQTAAENFGSPVPDFATNTYTDDQLTSFWNDYIGYRAEPIALCYNDQILLVRDLLIPSGETDVEALVLNPSFECGENNNQQAFRDYIMNNFGWIETGNSQGFEDNQTGSANVSGSVRQNLVGLDEDPEAEAGFFGLVKIDDNEFSWKAGMSLKFGGRTFTSNKRTFTEWTDFSSQINPLVISNQDEIVLSVYEDSTDGFTGTLKKGDVVHGTVSEENGVIVVTYSDDSFVSLQ